MVLDGKGATRQARSLTTQTKTPVIDWRLHHDKSADLFRAAAVFISTGIDFDFVTDFNKRRHHQLKTSV